MAYNLEPLLLNKTDFVPGAARNTSFLSYSIVEYAFSGAGIVVSGGLIPFSMMVLIALGKLISKPGLVCLALAVVLFYHKYLVLTQFRISKIVKRILLFKVF
jgi:hypothetical protein